MKVVIVGCGVIGATIAYHLVSHGIEVEVWDQHPYPGLEATGAALGLVMAVSSLKLGGDLPALRLHSLSLYPSLLAQLTQETGRTIPIGSGILCLPRPADRSQWESLCVARRQQGYALQWVTPDALAAMGLLERPFGVYSPADRVLHPSMLLQALVEAGQKRGVQFSWGKKAEAADLTEAKTTWWVMAAGLGTPHLVELPLQSVGGQGIRVYLPGLPDFPNIHALDHGGRDINIVPLGNQEYWIGATVEFNPQPLPRSSNVTELIQRAMEFLPQFQAAKVIQTWAGYRPRPIDRRAPVIGFSPTHSNVIIASGHYRSGILLAPVTAQIVGDLIIKGACDLPWQSFAPTAQKLSQATTKTTGKP